MALVLANLDLFILPNRTHCLDFITTLRFVRKIYVFPADYLLNHGRDNSRAASKRKGIVIVPPVYIDPSVSIKESVIGPHVSIGPGCVIQHSLIQDSIIDDHSQIIDASLIQSLIGREARVIGQQRSLNIGDSSEIIHV